MKFPRFIAPTLTTCALVVLIGPGIGSASAQAAGPKITIKIKTVPAHGRKPMQMTAIAIVKGVTAPANSTVDFSIYGPDTASCSPSTFFGGFGNDIVGPGGVARAGHISVFKGGTYQWIAAYHTGGNATDPTMTFTTRCGDASTRVAVP